MISLPINGLDMIQIWDLLFVLCSKAGENTFKIEYSNFFFFLYSDDAFVLIAMPLKWQTSIGIFRVSSYKINKFFFTIIKFAAIDFISFHSFVDWKWKKKLKKARRVEVFTISSRSSSLKVNE